MPSLVEEIILGVLQPGVNAATLTFLNVVLFLLAISLAVMLLYGHSFLFVGVPLFLTLGLAASLNW